jgi:LmeA-like phospholipid-binding
MPDLGEQAISKAAEIGLASQLDEVEELNVDIRTNPLKLIQGELESVSIEGKGLVMQQDLRAEELKVNIDNIAINPLSAAFGKIELNHPTEAETFVVLTEADIDRAFNSEFLSEKLQNQKVHVNGQPMTIDTKQVEFRLPGEGKFAVKADVLMQETDEIKQVSFTAVPRMREGGNRLSLEEVQYAEGEEISPELTQALLEQSSELLDLRNFELQGMSLRLKHLDVQPGKLTLQAEALVTQFPSS